MLHGTMMGQLIATLHSKSLKLSGYFRFAFLQLEMAFFIGSQIPITRTSILTFDDKSKFECPTNVPYQQFYRRNIQFYLGQSKLSQGIYNHLLWFLGAFISLLPIFYKEVI